MSNPSTRRKAVQEDCMLKDDCVCRDMASFSHSDKESRARTDRGTGNKLGHITRKEMSKQCATSRTSLVKKTRKRDGKRVRAKTMQDSVKEVVTPPRKKARDEAEEVMKGTRKQRRFEVVQVLVKAPPRPLAVMTPVVFDADDGKRHTRDLWIECWTANNGGVSSVWPSEKNQHSDVKEEASRSNLSEIARLRR